MLSLDRFATAKLDDAAAMNRRRRLVATSREDGLYVERGGRRLLSFSCNDYLNLTQHPEVKAAAIAAVERWGTGAGASRLVTGNHPLYAALEERLARFKGSDAACVFGSGYLANAAIVPALAGEDDIVLLDALSHACLWAGAQLSRGAVSAFRHNDAGHLADLLAERRGKYRHALVATEGVFSMDGDRAPLAELAEVAERYDAWLLVDDAHGFGTLGDGRGSVAEARARVPLQMGTLSKAAASYGGYLCASRAVVDLMASRARPLIYSTGLPPAAVAAAICRARHHRARARPCGKTLGEGARLHARRGPARSAKRDRAGAARRRSGRGCGAGDARGRRLPGRGDPAAHRSARHGAAADRVHRLASRRRGGAPCRPGARACDEDGGMSGLFLTGTGTDIGKTFVAVGLIRELRRRGRAVAALKPVASGFEEWSAPASDPARLLAALDLPGTPDEIARIAPFRYRAPVAPELAARREGRALDYDALVAFCRAELAAAELLLVEGIGGVMVPLDGERTVLDWIADLRLPALVVAGNYLGTISHTLTALAALRQRHVPVAAVVVSANGESPVPLAENAASIARFAHGTKVLALPLLEAGAGHPVFGMLADLV